MTSFQSEPSEKRELVVTDGKESVDLDVDVGVVIAHVPGTDPSVVESFAMWAAAAEELAARSNEFSTWSTDRRPYFGP